MDNTQYDKRFTNRNKIVKPDGFLWISVPINKSHKFSLNKDVAINNDIHWQKDHWQKIFHSYNKSKFFQKYKDDLKQIFEKKWEYLQKKKLLNTNPHEICILLGKKTGNNAGKNWNIK